MNVSVLKVICGLLYNCTAAIIASLDFTINSVFFISIPLENTKAGVTCPYASLSFSAISIQTAAASLLPVVPGSQSYVRLSTAGYFLCDEIALPEIWKSDVRKWKSSMRVYSRNVLSRPSGTMILATPPKNSYIWTWAVIHDFCFISRQASTYAY